MRVRRKVSPPVNIRQNFSRIGWLICGKHSNELLVKRIFDIYGVYFVEYLHFLFSKPIINFSGQHIFASVKFTRVCSNMRLVSLITVNEKITFQNSLVKRSNWKIEICLKNFWIEAIDRFRNRTDIRLNLVPAGCPALMSGSGPVSSKLGWYFNRKFSK